MRIMVFLGALLALIGLGSLQACGEDEPTYHCGYILIPNTVGEGQVAGYSGLFQEYYEVIVEETGSGGYVPFSRAATNMPVVEGAVSKMKTALQPSWTSVCATRRRA